MIRKSRFCSARHGTKDHTRNITHLYSVKLARTKKKERTTTTTKNDENKMDIKRKMYSFSCYDMCSMNLRF